MSENNAPRRLTPTERLQEVTLAALHRTPVRASESVEVSRNAKGDYQWTVAGIAGEEESLTKVAQRVLNLTKSMDETLPLSRKQILDREVRE